MKLCRSRSLLYLMLLIQRNVGERYAGGCDKGVREGWNHRFGRPFNDWEIKEVENFMTRLSRRMVRDLEDMVHFGQDKK